MSSTHYRLTDGQVKSDYPSGSAQKHHIIKAIKVFTFWSPLNFP